jgi:hypothetical protein
MNFVNSGTTVGRKGQRWTRDQFEQPRVLDGRRARAFDVWATAAKCLLDEETGTLGIRVDGKLLFGGSHAKGLRAIILADEFEVDCSSMVLTNGPDSE